MTANSTTVALIALISTVPCGVGSAQQGACVSKRAGSVPAAFAAIVARERTLVCERLATRIPGVQVAVAVNGKLVWSEGFGRSEEHTSELQSQSNLVCRLLLEKKKNTT